MYKLISPLRIKCNKSTYKSLNINTYRNIHHFTNNMMKKNYKFKMMEQINKLPKLNKIEVTYTLYPKTKRLCDVSNICCIVDKFFMDALIDLGKLEDDNYLFLPKITYLFGEVDKENPRCLIEIKEII